MAKSCDGADVLALELTRYTAFNNALSLAEIMPLLRKLLPQKASVSYTAFDLLCLLQAREEVEAAVVAKRFHLLMLKEAVLTAQVRLAKPELALRPSPLLDHLPQDMQMGWRNDEHVLAVLRQAAQLERDRVFLSAVAPDLSGPLHAVTAACGQQRRLLFALAARWDLLPLSRIGANDAEPPESEFVPAELGDLRSGEEVQLEALAARVRAAAQTWAPGRAVPDALRELVAWPGAAAVAPLRAVCAETPAWKPYVEHALALRTRLEYTHWEDWEGWLKGVGEKAAIIREHAARLADEFRDELRLLRLKDPAGPRDDVRMAALESAAAERAKLTVGPAEFVRRWEHVLSPADVRRLCGEPPAEGRRLGGAEAQERETRLPAPPPLPQKEKAAPPPPPAPSFWDRHIRPFIAANWYLLAGLLMVVSGASLLAYFTWDKSVFVRYLFLPVLLGAFTAGLAELGLRLYRRHDELRATGSFLLGGAVCLLPVNFMVLCRAGADPLAAHLILPAFGLYATLAGAGLWRWCGALRSELRILLGLPLLAVNLLAVLGDLPPLREAFAAQGAGLVPVTLTAAVLLLLAVTDRFLWRVLDSAMLASKYVPWFFGITMAATTVQVAAWRHFHLRAVPQPQDYALATILTGALLLRWERRVGQIRNSGAAYGGESFLGYAALMAGILLSATHEWLRLAALFLAGVIWLVQAPRRPGVAHYWVGLTLCLLGGAACGMLPVFPKRGALNLLPELGLALALAAGGVRVLAGRLGDLRLRQVAREIQPPILLLTAVIALLSHYHLRSAPWQTGLVLLAVALFFAVRGTREQRREGLFVAAAAAGLSLPYLGCADMGRYGFADNTLALGFGVLAAAWQVAARLLRSPLWRASCGGIVTCLGAFGLVGLGLRLLLAGTPVLAAADLAGGALLSAALAAAAWQTREQTPALMVAVLLAVILPLFQVPAGVVPAGLHVGSGLTSAAVALALMAGCFRGRREERERHLPGLFTRPALFAVAWLSGQALAHQIQRHDVPWPFIASMLLVSTTGYVAALFFRERRSGKALFHLSWPLLGVGIVLGCRAAGCRGVEWIQHPLLWTGVAMTALAGLESACARRWAWITDFLVRPRLALLSTGSAAVALGLAAGLVGPLSQERGGLQGLAGFLAAQLVWHALRSRRRRFGAVLFALAAAWLSVSPNAHALCGAVPVFLLAALLADVGLERCPRSRDLLSPLRTPFIAGATGLALALFGAALLALRAGVVLDFGVPRQDIYALLAALLLAARAQSCAGLVLPVAALAYLLLLVPCAQPALFQPWRLSSLAGVLCLMPFVGRSVTARCPQLLRGGNPQFPALAAAVQAPWLLVPGVALAVGAAAWQMALSASGQSLDPLGIQILPPFAAVAAFALAGGYGRRGALWAVAACLLPLAHAFACAVVWGRELLDRQLTPAHIVGLAAVATVAELAAVRLLTLRLMRPAMTAAARWLHGECVVLAGLTLVLLGMNYLASPDLAHIPALRFLASGLLALGAGTYFRSAARRPEHVQTSEGVSMEALWHVALGLALWCAALMVPALRTPHAALYALALPAVACWCAAETFLNLREGTDRNRLIGLRFLNSAAAFAVLVLVLFVFRLPFQLLLFPGAPLDPRVYHTGSAAVLAAGLILLRLRGLGGAPWLALTGGLALMAGVFFGVTGLPGLSPFVFPMAAAWTSVFIAHLLILLSCRQSPLRTLIQHVGGIGAEEWQSHRRLWGTFLTFAAHGAVLHGLLSGGPAHSADTTPLLAALSSVLVHQAWIGSPCANVYRAVAVVELVLALHLDFLLPAGSPGLIPSRHVVWFVLSSWLGAALFWTRVRQPLPLRVMWCAAGGLALLSAGHLCYHGAASGSGVLIAALLTLAGLLTPRPDIAPGARLAALTVFAAPVWLAYFGTRWLTGDGPAGFRPLLAGAAALLGSGVLVRVAAQKDRLAGFSRACVRLADEALDLCRRDGERLARALLCAAFAGLVFITFLHGEARHGSLGLMLGLAFVWGLSCAAWFREGTLRDGACPYALAVLSLAGTWTVLRRLLFQHFSFWTYEYDIWLSLGASLAFSAAKRLVRHQRPGLARTMTGTVWLLPAVQGVWLLATRMNADLTLLVLGVQSMLFAWQGGGRRDSPYNAVSVLGFVGFVCLLFWAKLDLRCLQAFTVPCGLGVLGLVWLFGEHMPSALRTAVRFFAVLTMLGSCGYYALLDQSYPVGFHVTMLVLCLAVMALGPALRVQLYLYFGFAGLVADLAALVVRQFQSLERSLQMMGVGALLLLLGIAVIGGAILFKTRREAIAACADQIRGRLRGWE